MTQFANDSYQYETAETGLSENDLRQIASRQKGIIFCLVLYIGALVAQFVLPVGLAIIAALLGIGATIAAVVFVFMLASKLYGPAVGTVLGLLTLIPFLGLIILLIVNGKATSTLSENGYEVGILGAQQATY